MAKKPATGKPTGKRGSKQQPPPPPRFQLTLDQWLDIVGYVLLAVAGLTILSFLSANHGLVPGWWLGVLRRTFGWGTYLVPLFVGAVGLWLVLRDFGDRLPRVTPQQVVGVLLGYLALLATLHLLAALFMYEGDIRAIAQAGHGGGSLGAALSGTLVAGLGGVGAGVVLVTWWLIVVALIFGVTVQDGVQAVQYAWGWLRAGRGGSRPSPTLPRPSLREPPDGALAQPTIRSAPSSAAAPPSSPSAASIQPRLFGSGQAWRIPALDDILRAGQRAGL